MTQLMRRCSAIRICRYSAMLTLHCSAFLLVLSFATSAQLCYRCSALLPLFSFATAAQLCYHCSALLPLFSFATAGQLCYRWSALQCKAEGNKAIKAELLNATERCSTLLSNARQYSAKRYNAQQCATILSNLQQYSAKLYSARQCILSKTQRVRGKFKLVKRSV